MDMHMQTSDHLDTAVLDELKEVMGEEYPQLLQTFIVDTANRIQHLDEAISSAQGDAIRRSAHSLKGSASNMGATQLCQYCRQLEQAGQQQEIEQSQRLLAAIRSEYQLLEQILSAQ